ncbi:MAG: hypothetical protein LQ351_006073 [Letrouitia transgressa]|nr:MAG: hypothetical protein LQ351_006073 [Letrouitia transgressa]
MTSKAVVAIDLQGKLPKLASGKIRDLFEVDDETLLLVTSDRISAFDVVMTNGVPGKGALLTKMRYASKFSSNPQVHSTVQGFDQSISKEQAYQGLGGRFRRAIEKLSLEIYSIAAKRTEEVGIILADTKFEFEADGENVVLIDEVVTPDSSRF